MVESETMDDAAIAAMMARIDAVPMMHTIAIEIQRMEQGLCVAKVPRRLEWDGIYETFHGGMLGVIADSVTCWAILTSIGADEKVATTDFNIRFLRPCHTDVVCTARTVRAGRTMCVADAEIHDMNGKLVASLRCPMHGSREATQDFLSP